jgi:plastocyanin
MKSFWFLALVAAATAQVQVSVVQVGNANGTLAFSPSSIQAEVGSFVQFQFLPAVCFHDLGLIRTISAR